MFKSGIDHDSIIDLFAKAGAEGGEQLRKAVGDATLAALQGRELSLQNIRAVLQSVAQAASSGAAKNMMPGVDAEALLDDAVAGMDAALVRAVHANRTALQQLVNQGVDLREKHLKKALADLDRLEETFIGALTKATGAAGEQLGRQWAPVLDKMRAGGTQSGAQAAMTAEEFMGQMQAAVRDSRAAGMRAAQTLAESYAALVSGVLIGMSEALERGPGTKSRRK
jgi:hypothetical protein